MAYDFKLAWNGGGRTLKLPQQPEHPETDVLPGSVTVLK